MIGLIAGTPYDTFLGTRLLEGSGLKCLGKHISETPFAQTNLQNNSPDKLISIASEVIANLKQSGCDRVLIYCNSMSLCLPIEKLISKLDIEIITPTQFYQPLIRNLTKMVMITANACSLQHFEKAFLNLNESLELFGMFSAELLLDIEKGLSSTQIIDKHDFDSLLKYFAAIGQKQVVLGCTHFSVISQSLQEIAPKGVSVYEPSSDIVLYLKSSITALD